MSYPSINYNKLLKIIPDIMEKLRNRGFKFGASYSLQILNLVNAYSLFDNTQVLSYNDVVQIFLSVLARNSHEEKIVKELLNEEFFDKNDFIIKELYLIKEKFENKQILPEKLNEKDYEHFVILKALNAVRKQGKFYRLVNESDFKEITRIASEMEEKEIEDKIISLIRSMNPEEIVKLQRSDLFYKSLNYLPIKKLEDLGLLLNKRHNKKAVIEIGKAIKERVIKGEKVNAKQVWDLLKSLDMLDDIVEKELMLQEQSLVKRSNLNLNDINKLSGIENGELVPMLINRYIKSAKTRNDIINIIRNVNPKDLWKLNRSPIQGDEGELINAAIYSSMALKESLEYIKTNNEGNKIMSRFYLSKAQNTLNKLENKNISLGNVNKSSILSIIVKADKLLDFLEKGETAFLDSFDLPLAFDILRNMYKRLDGEQKIKIERIAKNYLIKTLSLKGYKKLPIKKKSTIKSGKLLIKETSMNIIRNKEDFLVYKRKVKGKQISLALDISSSMADYSSWALSISSIFLHNINKLVLFSSKPIVYKGLSFNKIVKLLLSLEFSGYTDISSALNELKDKNNNLGVIITDLKQTIKNRNPESITKELTNYGMKLIFILPKNHDNREKHLIEENGGIVKVVSSPEGAAREIIRILRY
ncbi:MAG: hypothetical protein ACP5I6_07025 [Caldisphaera sp.]|jgi:hypothetical protein|nr:MAG: hypothetical protein C0171_06240 [Caldisphaera sp.]